MKAAKRLAHAFACALAGLGLALGGALPAQASFFLGGVGIKDEVEMGRKFDTLIRSQLPMIDDPEVNMYVRSIVDRLLSVLPPQPFKYTTGVIRHNTLNAFAVPGGYVYVFSGLLMNFDAESELAGVLAHELAHVTQRHVASRIERGQMLALGALLASVAGVALGGNAGGAVVMGALTASQSAMLNYSRIDENEADHQGFQYLLKAGYDPQGMVDGFQKLRRKSWMSGGGNIPTYLSTHPDIGDRIANIAARIKSQPAGVRSRKEDGNRFQRVKTLLLARYGDTDAARQAFAKSPAGDCLARMGEGMIFARQNKIPEAAKAFERALQCGPDDALVLREAGIFHYGRGDQNRAGPLLLRAMEKDPRDYMARFYYARLMDETGKPQAAHPYYRDVLRHIPDDADVHEFYGRSLGRANMFFPAYLHLAYAALFSNNKKKTEQFMGQAKSAIRSPEEQARFDRFSERHKERSEIWKEIL
ncbi:MAG: M48 family metalloprotease [Deltaproteobacteria bacterium]|jgi:predicted Zn-dependent protease|nr:M48 family metalloprotease [Deltaproteobacteria bacterium]